MDIERTKAAIEARKTAQDFSIVDATTPNHSDIVFKDYYFWCVDGDPKQLIVYKRFRPVGNQHEEVAMEFTTHKKFIKGTKLVKIPLAFVPLSTADYYLR